MTKSRQNGAQGRCATFRRGHHAEIILRYSRRWQSLGESNPSLQIENLASYPIDEGTTLPPERKVAVICLAGGSP